MWRVRFTKECRNYIIDSFPYTEKIWQTIKLLRFTEDGLPYSNYQQLSDGAYLWIISNHWVLFERDEDEKIIRVLKIQPDSD